MLNLLFVNFLFALTYPVIDFVTQYSSINTLLFLRMFIAGLIILVFQLIKNYKKLILKKEDILSIILISIFNIFFTFLIETYSIKNITGIEVSILYLLSPIISLIVGNYFFDEKINFKRLIFLIFTVLISFFFISENSFYNILNLKTKYHLLLLLSIIGSIFSWYKIKKLLNKYEILTINGYAFLISGVLFFINGIIFDKEFLIIKEANNFFIGLFSLILIGNLFAYNLYEKILRKYSMNTIVLSWFLTPFFLFFINFILFGEYPKFNNLISCLIIFFCLKIFYSLEEK